MKKAEPIATIEQRRAPPPPDDVDPALTRLVEEIIGRVADKWTMLILEALEEHGTMRFTQLGQRVGAISQKMLTKTVRQMKCDGLVERKVYPVAPPRVKYSLSKLGRTLGAAFCGVCIWAETYHDRIEASRAAFAARRECRPISRAPGSP